MATLNTQRGGTLQGIIIGLLIGLGIALAVAIYVTKVPVPFLQKVTPASQTKPEDEAKRNKDWDPNAPLYGKNAPPVTAKEPPPTTSTTPSGTAPAAKSVAGSDPIAVIAAKETPAVKPAAAKPQAEPNVAKPGDPWMYFLQAGAYREQAQAEQQRAKLAMLGFEARITEREQNGIPMYRVRMGPYNTLDDINRAKEKLETQSIEGAIVRVPR
jgi:cell division protein FtsN